MRIPDERIQEMKTWHEEKSGKKITDEEAKEAAKNLVAYFRLLERSRPKPREDTNSQAYECQLVDE